MWFLTDLVDSHLLFSSRGDLPITIDTTEEQLIGMSPIGPFGSLKVENKMQNTPFTEELSKLQQSLMEQVP